MFDASGGQGGGGGTGGQKAEKYCIPTRTKIYHTHHRYEKEGRYFSPKPQHEGVPNMNDRGRLSANTGITAHSDTNPTTLPSMPSGVVPGIVSKFQEKVRLRRVKGMKKTPEVEGEGIDARLPCALRRIRGAGRGRQEAKKKKKKKKKKKREKKLLTRTPSDPDRPFQSSSPCLALLPVMSACGELV